MFVLDILQRSFIAKTDEVCFMGLAASACFVINTHFKEGHHYDKILFSMFILFILRSGRICPAQNFF
jgi:hypothetical protein